MDKQAVEILTKARALICQGWCQGAFAKTAKGTNVIQHSKAAVQWCAAGAVLRVNGSWGSVEDYLNRSVGATFATFTAYNDAKGRTQSEVLAMFDKAIKLAKE